MSNKWWETETPKTIESSKNVINWYPKAQKLQVARPNWTTDDGEVKPGKTVVLDVSALIGVEGAAEVLRDAASALEEAQHG